MENTIRVNPLKYPNIKCKCGCEVWNQGVILKRVPGLEMGQGTEDVFVDLPVWYCAKCGEILPEYKEMYKMDDNSNAPKSEIPTKLIV